GHVRIDRAKARVDGRGDARAASSSIVVGDDGVSRTRLSRGTPTRPEPSVAVAVCRNTYILRIPAHSHAGGDCIRGLLAHVSNATGMQARTTRRLQDLTVDLPAARSS